MLGAHRDEASLHRTSSHRRKRTITSTTTTDHNRNLLDRPSFVVETRKISMAEQQQQAHQHRKVSNKTSGRGAQPSELAFAFTASAIKRSAPVKRMERVPFFISTGSNFGRPERGEFLL